MVVSRREAEGAATFNFQRNDATTQRPLKFSRFTSCAEQERL
jgi:hypothetical protein